MRLIASLFLCLAVAQALAEPKHPVLDGIAQVSQVPSFSLTARPKYVFCGEGLPCPEPTPKTLAIVARAVEIAPTPNQPSSAKEEKPKEIARLPSTVVRFAFNKAALSAKAKSALDEFAVEVKKLDDDLVIKVSGRTDSIGSKSYNDRLAARRAQAVKKYLTSAGIPSKRIQMVAAGKCCYVATNNTEAGRAANRRAEVVFVSVSTF